MDTEDYSEAVEKLEQEYLGGGMSADEYTRRRRQLERAATSQEELAEPESSRSPVPALAASELESIASDPGADTGPPLASWGRRAAGWLIDVVVYAVGVYGTLLVALLIDTSETGAVGDGAALMFLVILVFGPTLYAWLMVGRWGQTLGKMAVGVQVVRAEDGAHVSYMQALGRAVSVWFLGVFALPLLLAYLWPLWDRRNQTLYDKMAGTIVVRKNTLRAT